MEQKPTYARVIDEKDHIIGFTKNVPTTYFLPAGGKRWQTKRPKDWEPEKIDTIRISQPPDTITNLPEERI